MREKTKDKPVLMIPKDEYETIKNEISITAILSSVYAQKISSETIHTKVTNQLNAIHVSIDRINPKFKDKSKNYDKIREQIVDTLNRYEANLVQFCQMRDLEIRDALIEKVERETEWLRAIVKKGYLYQRDREQQSCKDKNIIHSIQTVVQKIKTKTKKKEQASEEYQENQKQIVRLEKEIARMNTKINDLNEQKIKAVFEAMEAGDKALSTQIRKPRTIKRITSFFANRFNTSHVILKSVIEPIEQRIGEFKVNHLQKAKESQKEFNLKEVEEKIKEKQEEILKDVEHKIMG